MILGLVSGFLHCGENEEKTADEATELLITEASAFATPDLSVSSGETIAIHNTDGTPHTVTSQSAEDAFDDSGIFDALVPANSFQLLTLPNAPPGTVFFYYCRFHMDSMTPTSGTITIE